MNEFTFLLCYLGLILIGSFILTGFYIIGKADKEIEPDGSIKYYGKVLKSWGEFLFREKGIKYIYFHGEQLDKKRMEIERSNPKFKGKLNISRLGIGIEISDGVTMTKEDRATIEMANRCKAFMFNDGPNKPIRIGLYEERINYVLPEWMRMTLGGCLPCSSSILGSLVYWAFILLQPDVFHWSSRPTLASFICWIGYCLSLVPVNMIVHRKTF